MADTLRQRLKELRKGQGLRQHEIADRLFLPLRTYQNYERGVNAPDIAMLSSMADLYGVSVDYLIGHEHEGKPDTVHHGLVALDDRERALIENYRACNRAGRTMLSALAEVLSQSARYGS
jgi:transcriptional regulator with XRE-family HTH domain